MPRPRLLTSISSATGWTLVVVQHGASYRVGTLSSHGRVVPLADSTYATYAAAQARLEQEAQQRRRAAANTTDGGARRP
jgi:hypothetical protein